MKRDAKVIRFRGKQYKALTLLEAMCEAIQALGGQAKVIDVCKWIHKHYAHRQWSSISMRNYFYIYSRNPQFFRIKRGVYRTVNKAANKKTA